MIPAVILAAGRSERMGRSKALLPFGSSNETFVSHLVTSLRAGGVDDVVVVGRTGDAPLAAEVLRCSARLVENVDADRGQLSSIVTGLDAVDHPGVHAVLVMPVDIPLVRPETIAQLLSAFLAAKLPIARTTFAGRHGHPVIFGRTIFDELRRADPSIGASAVVRIRANRVLNVDVDDRAVVHDVDTPEDYERTFS